MRFSAQRKGCVRASAAMVGPARASQNERPLLFIFVVSIASLILLGVTPVDAQQPPTNPAPLVTNPNLKYFGYYVTDFSGFDSYFPEIRSLGNSNVIRGFFPYNFLRKIKDANLLALMGPPGGWASYASFLRHWNIWKQDLPPDLRGTIYAFFYDEPFWQHRNDPAFPRLFERITGKIHADFPDKAIMIVDAWPLFRDNKFSPTSDIVAHGLKYVTDISIASYYAHDGRTWAEYLQCYNKLRLISGNRKIWLSTDGYAGSQNHPANPAVTRLLPSAFENYLRLANSDRKIVGMLNFVYGTHPNFPVNLRQMFQMGNVNYNPSFRSRQIAVGKAVIAN